MDLDKLSAGQLSLEKKQKQKPCSDWSEMESWFSNSCLFFTPVAISPQLYFCLSDEVDGNKWTKKILP